MIIQQQNPNVASPRRLDTEPKVTDSVLTTPTPDAKAPAGPQPGRDSFLITPPQVDEGKETVQGEAETSLGARVKKKLFQQKRADGRIHGSIMNKIQLGAVGAACAWSAVKIGMDLAAAPTLGAALGTAALDVVGLGVGYMAADVASGILHHWADQYADPESKNQFARRFAKQAQRHHYHPTGLGDYTLSAWANPVSLVSWAPLAAANMLNLPAPILAAGLTTVLGTNIYGLFHMYSHKNAHGDPKEGWQKWEAKTVRTMQKLGLAIGNKEHATHHRLPWNSDFCIVSGQMNKVFDKIGFWPKYEKAVFSLTGKAPESWKIPQYKAYVDGKISKEEYMAQFKEIRAAFMDTEYHERKAKWKID